VSWLPEYFKAKAPLALVAPVTMVGPVVGVVAAVAFVPVALVTPGVLAEGPLTGVLVGTAPSLQLYEVRSGLPIHQLILQLK
jgi:hypothetical protein